jgi:CobQ-like glutamine amidotransferase family enzyme
MIVRLVNLFPAELSSSGDLGNTQAVAYRLNERGIDVQTSQWSGNSEFPSGANAYFIGNGSWSAANIVLEKLRPYESDLKEAQDLGSAFFAVGAGAEILSESVTDGQGILHNGIGLFPFTARREADRRVGYMKVVTEHEDYVGFGDFASVWDLAMSALPLGTAIVGDRAHEPFVEGVRVGSSVATRLGGPALPLNPAFADRIVESIALGADLNVSLDRLPTDEYPENARAVIMKHLDTHFSTIAL